VCRWKISRALREAALCRAKFGGTKIAFGHIRSSVTAGIAERTPNRLASYDAAQTTEHDRAALVEASWSFVVEAFMRSFMVEDLPEAVELLLLKAKCQCWRFRRVFFESSVHALMPPVLLRPARLDSFVHNPHLRPAQRQLGQAEQAGASEWRAVVGSDPCRHPVLAHGVFADGPHFT
jgi:hypothetical protein